MDRAFYRIYREQLERYRASQLMDRDRELSVVTSLAAVSEAIDTGLPVLGQNVTLRPDAALFLYVNLHQLVTAPLLAHPASELRWNDGMQPKLNEDVRTILKAAVDVDRSRRDLAASHVLWGTGQVLENLNLKSWRLWERE